MSELSTTETAFEGLRLTRERPLAVIWWWAAYTAATVVQFIITVQPAFISLNQRMVALQTEYEAVQQHPDNAAAAQQFVIHFGQVAWPMLMFTAVMLLMQMVLSTAVLRAVLRPSDRAAGYLRLGMDELRQLGLALIVLAALLFYAFGVSIASGLVIGLLDGLTGGRLAPQAMGAITVGAIWVAFIYPAVRLSLAPAMTLADRRISFLRAWALTKDRFWPLLGAYALAFVIALVIVFCGVKILELLTHLVASNAGALSVRSLNDLASPAVIVTLIGNGLLGAAVGAVATAPIASAFRQLAGRVGAPLASSPVPSTGSPWGSP
jgi:hypothetical protein